MGQAPFIGDCCDNGKALFTDQPNNKLEPNDLIVIILSCLSPLLSLLQYLSAPVTDKVTLSGNTDAIDYGISSHQGWRRTQEDAHFAVELSAHCHLFGVFDGHGGPEVAKFCSSNLPAELQKMDCFAAGDFPASLRQVFHRMDALMRTDHGREQLESLRQKPVMRFEDRKDDENDEGEEEVAFDFLRRVMALQRKIEHVGTGLSTTSDDSDDATIATARPTSVEDEVQAGCTAVVALLRQNQLYVANAGDSRAVLSRNGNALALSQDHKPGHVEERERIVKAGGFLSEIGGITRVNGNLNLSRAIGDLRYKNNAELHPAAQIITAEPDIEHISLQSEDRFLILACDGIWDVMSNQEVVDFVQQGMDAGKSPTEIASELLNRCLASDPRETRGIGCDNMTAAIIIFHR